jgi:UDP-N-acetylmuramoyl-L-alanyl-D-glutamate--2,6-diaminopimelate ligase
MSKRFVQLVKNYLKHLPTAFLANVFFLFPSRRLKLVGVTGTDGKTTTASLIYHLLQQSGIRAGLVSTVGVKLSGEEFPLDFHVTSPPPWKLQRFLKMMADNKLTHAVLEVTSHALDQFRFFGCSFYITVLTNVTHEHLDYHGSFNNYLATKMKLLGSSPTVVVNKDDPSFKQIAGRLLKKKLLTFAIKERADYQAKACLSTRKGVSYDLWIKGKKVARISSALFGDFNVYNQLAAAAVADQLGVDLETIVAGLKSFPGVVGRLEFVPNKKRLKIVIDFAHTPNALRHALKALREILPKGGRLIVVFGSAGLRDKQKRPLMGKVAAELADVAVLTSEDPRTEDPWEIIKEIGKGCLAGGMSRRGKRRYAEVRKKKVNKVYFTVVNRQEAINFAIRKLARQRDIVVICGKGHEKSMCFGKTEYPWSEHEAVRIALREN